MQLSGHPPTGPEVVQYERDGAWIVVPHGDYDPHSIGPVEDALETAAKKYSRVVVDVTRLRFADSSFLNLLLRTHRTTSLCIVSPPTQLRRVFEITGADEVLDIRATVEEAVH